MKEFFEKLISEWWGIAVIVVVALAVWVLLSALLYRPFFKRFYDIVLSGLALIVLSPILLILTVLGAIKMKGNPFFTQMRSGKGGKVFRLIKFRTMTCEKDENGELLPDEKRLTKYGKILRATSLDELPELINIFIGNMSIIGPRPLLKKDILFLQGEEVDRLSIRPGLSGLAQVNGRNNLSWKNKFQLDIKYVKKYSLFFDIAIIFKTIGNLFFATGVEYGGSDAEMDYGEWLLLTEKISESAYRETMNRLLCDEK